jgi:hypothetical protein
MPFELIAQFASTGFRSTRFDNAVNQALAPLPLM